MKINKEYQNFISLVDKEYSKISSIHNQHMVCKKGCSSCCISIRLFPIEYFHIKSKIESTPRALNNKNSNVDSCAFLDQNGACTIYEHRPLLCRTHGVPLLHFNDNIDDWEVALCELNFQEYDGDFTTENTYHEDTWNSQLYAMNKNFIKTLPENYFENDMLELDDLY